MKDFIPYVVTAALALIVGALLVRQCSSPEVVTVPGETIRDTVRLPADTVILTKTRIEYRKPVQPFAPSPPANECCEELAKCGLEYDKLSLEYWYMANIVADGRLALPWGSVAAEFSMPRYAEDPQDAFRFTATRAYADSTEIRYEYRPLSWYDRIGIGPYVGFGYPAGASAGVAITYTFFRPSDIWR